MSVRAQAPALSSPAPLAPSAASGWRAGLAGTAIALVLNALVLTAASASGADMVARSDVGGPAMTIGLGTVALMTAVPMLLATLLLVAVRRRAPRAWRALATIGLLVGLATAPAPLTVSAGTSTQLSLALMHVVAGVVWFAVVRRSTRRAA